MTSLHSALENVKGLDPGEQNGSGVYGAVYEVMGMELHCIAKGITTF